LARAGRAFHRVFYGDPVERELHVFGGHRGAIVELDAGADLEIIDGGRDLGHRFRDFGHHHHVRITRQKPVIHVADDGFGFPLAVVGGVERVGIKREADHEVGGMGTGGNRAECHRRGQQKAL